MALGFLKVYTKKFSVTNGKKREYLFLRQHPVPVIHETIKLEAGFRADLIIDRKVVVEFKSIEQLADVHYKQVLTYLKLTNLKLGILVNFNVSLIKTGIKRIVNKL